MLAAFAVFMGCLLGSVRGQRRLLACESLSVEFMDSLKFVTADDIQRHIARNYGNYVGQRLDSLGLRKIEELVESRGPVVRCEAWADNKGVLHVAIWQRAPVLRFSYPGGGYYVDRNGYVFPLHDSFDADVRTVGGAIPYRPAASFRGQPEDEQTRNWINDMIALDRYIRSSRSFRGIVDSVFVRKDGDVAIKLKGGDEQFIIGDPDSPGRKFSKIEKYYTHIAPSKGKGYYKTVNLKYKNQIICRQKDI